MKKLYAMQVMTGDEELLRELLYELCGLLGPEDIFLPKRQLVKRMRGELYVYERNLFPGYLFLRVEDAERLFFALKEIPRFTALLHDGDYEFLPLAAEEQQAIEDICRLGAYQPPEPGEPACYTLELSQVEVVAAAYAASHPAAILAPYQEDYVHILSGPLLEMADRIVRFNLHKRYVVVRTAIRREPEIFMGLELKRHIKND